MEKTDDNTEQDNTEQRIMKAAEELFLMNGFARTTTVAIARKAGVTHAMLHYYYRTKEHIFIRVLDRNLTELLASFHPVMKKDAPFWETLESGISTHFDYLMNHPQLPSFIIDTMRYSPELLESYKPRIMATLGRILDFHIAIIREEVEKGRIRKVNPLQLLLDICQAYRDARRHKRKRAYQLKFEFNLEDNLVNLRDELYAGTYRPGPSSC